MNGHAVRSALLGPGDQLVIDGRNRFVVESPSAVVRGMGGAESAAEPEPSPDGEESTSGRLPSAVRRLPWLLLAAVLIAGALSLLLLYGAR